MNLCMISFFSVNCLESLSVHALFHKTLSVGFKRGLKKNQVQLREKASSALDALKEEFNKVIARPFAENI